MSACLSDDHVLAFVAGELPVDARSAADEHLGTCADCRTIVAEAARGLFETGGSGGADVTVNDARPPQTSGPARALEPGALVARYKIVRPIGAGGSGVVYEAFDPQLGRRVALKMVRQDVDSDTTWRPLRLLREAQAMARLSHPNVVNVHDAGTFEGQVFLAMEYVDGRTVARWIEEARPDWRQIVRVFLEAGRGLAAAHSAHLIHRDFKPENVLVGNDGRVRVTDFGLARANHASEPERGEGVHPAQPLRSAAPLLTLTGVGSMAGTPAYMAPEQFQGARADERTDQFNFCASLHRSLYRQLPFGGPDGDGVTVNTLAGHVLSGRLRPPPAKTEVPPSLYAIVRRGLSLDPAARFPSMSALLDSLAAVVEPPRAVSPPVPRRRRWTMVFALATGAAVVGLAAHFGPVGGSRDERPARAESRVVAAAPAPVAHETPARLSLPRPPPSAPSAPEVYSPPGDNVAAPAHSRASSARRGGQRRAITRPSAAKVDQSPATHPVVPAVPGQHYGDGLRDPFAPVRP